LIAGSLSPKSVPAVSGVTRMQGISSNSARTRLSVACHTPSGIRSGVRRERSRSTTMTTLGRTFKRRAWEKRT
jgi:hypothetical protein